MTYQKFKKLVLGFSLAIVVIVWFSTLGYKTEPTLDNFQDGHVYIDIANSIVEFNSVSQFKSFVKQYSFGIVLPILYASVFKIVGFNYLILNFINLLLIGLSTFFVFKLARFKHDQFASGLICLVFLTMGSSFLIMHSYFSEILYLPLSLGSIYFFSRDSQSDKNSKSKKVALLFLILAFFSRPVGVSLMLSVLVWFAARMLHSIWKLSDNLFARHKRFIIVGITGVISILVIALIVVQSSELYSWHSGFIEKRIIRDGMFSRLPDILSAISNEIFHFGNLYLGAVTIIAIFAVSLRHSFSRLLLPNIYLFAYFIMIAVYPAFMVRLLWVISPLILINFFTVLTFISRGIGNFKLPCNHFPEYIFALLLFINIFYYSYEAVKFSKQDVASNIIKSFKWIDETNPSRQIIHFRSNFFVRAHKLDKKFDIQVKKTGKPRKPEFGKISKIKGGEYIITPADSDLAKRFSAVVSYRKGFDSITKSIEEDPRFALVKQIGDARIWKKRFINEYHFSETELVSEGQFNFEIADLERNGWITVAGKVDVFNRKLRVVGEAGKGASAYQLIHGLKKDHIYYISLSAESAGTQITIEVGDGNNYREYADINTVDSHPKLEFSFRATSETVKIRLCSWGSGPNHYALFDNVSIREIL